ncbi:lytic murein transglycosylase [Methylobacter sp. BlB1]|uniref:lytic murein transglycosylase n=1 Tax=Methylobacter sp. BlB1 TaxID=2785914 RepID=UPI001893FA85|nr:lytic murein transglycosylase [Methylobacter sp. BlB1]MBF6650155.1 lytic murein transglycosylase [Methylobacter sp. BlB1]
MLITNVVYKRAAKLALTLLLVGCASDTENYRSDTLGSMKPQNRVPSQPNTTEKNTIPPLQPYRKSTSFPVHSADALTGIYAYSQPVHTFIRHMVQKHGFSEKYLNALFSQATRLDSVIRLENAQKGPSSGPSIPKPGSWSRYRSKFLTSEHIAHGAEFWAENADVIQRASATYGVDPEYIVAIIGVETYFGRNIGKTCIFNALATLAFDTERRASFFATELENFLLMTREEGFEPFEPVGSWAGAMGLGQFMPSSFRRLAVDFDNNGVRNLWNQHDAIGSVAHYFSRSGWQPSKPVAHQAHGRNNASTIALSTYEGNEFWQVYPNFKVIKRYNNSDKYAMAVHQLAQAIKQRYAATQGGPALVMRRDRM